MDGMEQVTDVAQVTTIKHSLHGNIFINILLQWKTKMFLLIFLFRHSHAFSFQAKHKL